MEHRKVSNPLGLAVMAVLMTGEMHPYQIAATLRMWHKEQSLRINYGSLYTVIAALEKAGYIEACETERDGSRPERTIYSLTSDGQAELDSWMAELLSEPVKEYPQFGSALSLIGVVQPDRALELLIKRNDLLMKRADTLRESRSECDRQGIERLFIIELEYELALLEAERKWLGTLIELIRTDVNFTKTWRGWHEKLAEAPHPWEEHRAGVGNVKRKDKASKKGVR